MNIVVTGAARGIGLELCKQLIAMNHRVFACKRPSSDTSELMALLLQHSHLISIHDLDVSSMESCKQFADSLGDTPLDALINNAGIFKDRNSSIDTLDLDAFTEVLDINTTGPLRVLQSLMVQLRQAKNPVVLNISSIMGALSVSGTSAHAYRTSKAALNKAMQVVATELHPEGIRIINAHPGWVRTDMGGSSADIATSESAQGLIELLNKPLDASGGFFNYNGQPMNW